MKFPFRIVGFFLFFFLIHSCKKDDGNSIDNSIKDGEGNVYTSVTIGTQVWMAENLKTTKYNDGTAIPNVINNADWINLITDSYCWYNNDPSNYKATFGALYNWYAVNTGKLCPKGWHVPTDTEWTTLTTSLGGEFVAGGKLKETGATHWTTPNTGATNETGFTAMPGGTRGLGIYNFIGEYGYWWSSTENSGTTTHTQAWYSGMYYFSTDAYRISGSKRNGVSVRCIRD
jgi:uncharacterized protein (TIGR02145 family)